MTNIYAESHIHEDEGNNAFSALDDAVDGYIPNDESHSHVTPSSRPTSSAQLAHAPKQLTNGHLNDDSDIESDVNRNRDDSVNVSDIESDVQRNSTELQNGDIDSDDSGSGRRVPAYRPSTPKPGVIRRSDVPHHEDVEDGGIDLKDIVIGDEDPAFNQTMIF